MAKWYLYAQLWSSVEIYMICSCEKKNIPVFDLGPNLATIDDIWPASNLGSVNI